MRSSAGVARSRADDVFSALAAVACLASLALAGCESGIRCGRNQVVCDGACVTLASNAEHCGTCGHACAAGEVCDGAGSCAASCRVGLTTCDGACTDTAHDPDHCGDCDAVCTAQDGANAYCGANGCTTGCPAGFDDCNGGTDGCESELHASEANCGVCGNACGVDEECASGRCVDAIVLYATIELSDANVYSGDLVSAAGAGYPDGRSAADHLCALTKPPGASCSRVRAFVSVNADDEVRDFPANYGVPTTVPVRSTSGETIDTSFLALLDGSIGQSLLLADVYPSASSAQIHWTGTNADGSLSETACDGWTATESGGNPIFTEHGWKWDANGLWIARSPIACQNPEALLCLCY